MGRDFMEASGLGASEQTKVGGNYVSCLVIICGTWRSKEAARVFLNLLYVEKGESHQTRGTFLGQHKKTTQGFDHWTALSGITYYFSFLWCKKIYTLHKIPSYKVWINFSTGMFFYLHYWFFINLRMTSEWAFAFFNTAVIIFCLMYSINIPYSN